MPIIKKIGEIVSYQAEDLNDAKNKMKQVKDLLLEMKPRRTARHLAAHDLLVLYIETNVYFIPIIYLLYFILIIVFLYNNSYLSRFYK